MMTFEEIKDKIRINEYMVSQHAFIESAKDELEDGEIRFAIINGEVIETYPDDLRGESILISGNTGSGKPLHVVLGIGHNNPVIITVYVPAPPKWTSPTKRGGS